MFKLMLSEWKRKLLKTLSKGKDPITRIYLKGNFLIITPAVLKDRR